MDLSELHLSRFKGYHYYQYLSKKKQDFKARNTARYAFITLYQNGQNIGAIKRDGQVRLNGWEAAK